MGIFDLFQNKKAKEPAKQEVVLPSLKQHLIKEYNISSGSVSGWSKLLENPDKVLRKTGKDIQVYDDVLSDPHVYACVQSRKSGVMSKEYDIDQYESDKSIVDFIEGIFNNFDISELTRIILDAPLYGYQPIEIIWEIVDGKYIPVKLHKRPRQYFKYNKDRHLMFVDDYGRESIVPEYKFIVPSYEASIDNPYGMPLLSKCYWSVVLKNDVRKFWSIMTEKFGMPWVKVNYSNHDYTDKDAVDVLKDSLFDMVQDAIVLLPEGTDFDIVSGNNKGSSEVYKDFIQGCKEDISEVLLGHTSATTSTPGKLGNEGMAISVVDRIIDSDKRLVESTCNTLIKMIVELNFTSKLYPKFRFYEEADINIERANRDAILSEKMNVRFTKDYIKREFNYYEEDFDIVEPSAALGGQPTEKKSVAPSDKLNVGLDVINNVVMQNSEGNSKEQKIADEFMDSILEPKKTDKIFSKVLKPIFDYAKKTELDKMDKDYYKLFKKIDTDEFTTLIERAMFIMSLHGFNSEEITYDKDDSNLAGIEYFNKGEMFTLKDLLLSLEKSPEEIVKFFESKGVVISATWKDTFDVIRKHAFTVSGVVKMDMLMDFKEMITKSISEGLSQSEFNKQLKEKFSAKGWLGNKDSDKLVEAWRLGVIYRTNLQNEFMNGRWNNHNININLRPYVQCQSTIDPSTTKECKALNNKVFRVDDEYFANHLRPLGHYSCRRTTKSLSEKQLKQRGLSVTKGITMAKYRNAKGFDEKGKVWSPEKSKYPNELFKEFETV